jgi:hypothetical protein
LADIVHVTAVVGCLHAYKVQLGLAQEAFHVEIGGNVADDGVSRRSASADSR